MTFEEQERRGIEAQIAREGIAYVRHSGPTNSTHFTTCCSLAVTRYERKCPGCRKYVYGWDAATDHARDSVRHDFAMRGRR